MASSTSLRQAGRHIRISQIQISSPTTRRHSSISSLIRSSTSRPKQPPRTLAYNLSQQSRSFSLWGSGSAAKSEKVDVPIVEPPTIETTRTVQALPSTSDNPDPTISQSHIPSPIEPQIVEDIQTSIAEPHLTDAATPIDPLNIADVPERLGYLKEVCGLDFGWGPTSFMQWSIEHLHIVGGFSWAASCILLGLIMRGSMAPLMVGAAKETAKMREMSPLTKPLMEQIQAARATGDQKRSMELQKELQVIRKTYGFKFYKAFLPILIQIPLGFGAWRILRNAATLPVPGFITESWLWTSDLTFSDPYFILPALGGALTYLTLKTNKTANKTVAGAETSQSHFMGLMMKVFPFITLFFIAVQPGAVQLYIVSSSLVGYLTALMMTTPAFRSAVKLPPLVLDPAPTPVGVANLVAGAEKQIPVAPRLGGLQVRRRSIAGLKTEVAKSSETPERDPNRSVIDKVVDAGKAQWSSVKQHAKGTVGSMAGSQEVAQKKKKVADRARQQAQYRADFEAARKEKEERLK